MSLTTDNAVFTPAYDSTSPGAPPNLFQGFNDQTITLIDGRTFSTSDIVYNPLGPSWQIAATGEDITWNITHADKVNVYGLSDAYVNELAYERANPHAPPPPSAQSQSIASVFTHQILTDPLGAPIDTLGNIAHNTTSDIAKNLPSFTPYLLLIGLGIFLLIKK